MPRHFADRLHGALAERRLADAPAHEDGLGGDLRDHVLAEFFEVLGVQ